MVDQLISYTKPYRETSKSNEYNLKDTFFNKDHSRIYLYNMNKTDPEFFVDNDQLNFSTSYILNPKNNQIREVTHQKDVVS
jgi:hypothetical protein